MGPATVRRRWASRGPRPWRKRFTKRKLSSRQRMKTKVPHKPRLVRRYIRRKMDDTKTHPNLKHLQTPSNSSEPKPKIPPTKVSGPLLHNDIAVDRKTTSRPAVIAEVTAVPNPIPDSGITSTIVSTNTVGVGSPLLGGATFNSVTSGLSIVSLVSVAPLTSTALHGAPKASFSALPPLDSFAAPTTGSVGVRPAAFPSQTSPTASASASTASSDSQSRQISAALVILVSVGSALLLLGFCIVVKMCHKPRRKARPTPSLPILKDADADEDYYETKESPIFGGEERMSAANGPMWNWVQYPHTKLSGPSAVPPVQHNHPSQQNQNPQFQAYSGDPGFAESRFHLATHPPPSIASSSINNQTPENYAIRAVYHNVPPAPAAKRMSRQSFYAPTNVEAPIENSRQEIAFTADGHDILKRSKAKAANRRLSQLGMEERRQRNSTVSFVGLPYDGDDVTSPTPMEYGHVIQDPPNLNNDYAGRARVKSGYFAAGTYPRMSTLPSTTYSIATATRINVAQRNSFSKDKISHQKGNSKRIRDTQALTYALGLASPRTEYGVPSPQPTLYPDDSLSVADGRRPKKASERKPPAENIPDVPVIVPMDNVDGSSDTLMGMSFGVSQISLTGLALEPVPERSSGNREAQASGSSSTSSMQAQGSRIVDKAPRVPSPPALPSLAQMGLARNNPEAYDSYRSPTYSLYGLYQTADRKSYVGR
jgi:hypothetical protein